MKEKIPKHICYDCKKRSGTWCRKFAIPVDMALQNDCGYGYYKEV